MLNRIVACFGLGTAFLALPLAALAQQSQPSPAVPDGYYWRPGPWNMMWSDGYGWHGWAMFPMMLLFLIFVAGIVFYLSHGLARRAGGRADWDDPTLPALRILNERFARGEIQREEFEEKKAALLFGGRR